MFLFSHHFEVNITSNFFENSEPEPMLQNQHVASNITTTDQTVHVYASSNCQALNNSKMGTSLRDVTLTFKRQGKMKTYFFFNMIQFSIQRQNKHKTETTYKIHKRSTALERSVKYFTGSLNRFHGANLTLNSDVDQHIDIWFA